MAGASDLSDKWGGMNMKDKVRLKLRKLDVGNRYSHLPLKKASVLIPLIVKGGKLCFLFTVRSMSLRRSPGEVCFPGGRSEPSDRDEIATALREAEEEVGLPAGQVEIICRLVPGVDKTRSLVTPVVAFVEDSFQACPNPEEVSDVFVVPLEYFIRPSKHTATQIQEKGNHWYEIHSFEYEDKERHTSFRIWGLTASFAIYVALAVLEEKPTFEAPYDLNRLNSSAEKNLMRLLTIMESNL